MTAGTGPPAELLSTRINSVTYGLLCPQILRVMLEYEFTWRDCLGDICGLCTVGEVRLGDCSGELIFGLLFGEPVPTGLLCAGRTRLLVENCSSAVVRTQWLVYRFDSFAAAIEKC